MDPVSRFLAARTTEEEEDRALADIVDAYHENNAMKIPDAVFEKWERVVQLRPENISFIYFSSTRRVYRKQICAKPSIVAYLVRTATEPGPHQVVAIRALMFLARTCTQLLPKLGDLVRELVKSQDVRVWDACAQVMAAHAQVATDPAFVASVVSVARVIGPRQAFALQILTELARLDPVRMYPAAIDTSKIAQSSPNQEIKARGYALLTAISPGHERSLYVMPQMMPVARQHRPMLHEADTFAHRINMVQYDLARVSAFQSGVRLSRGIFGFLRPRTPVNNLLRADGDHAIVHRVKGLLGNPQLPHT